MVKNTVLSFAAAMLAAMSISVAAVLVFSLMLTFADIPSFVVTLINYFIKLTSIAVGAFMFASEKKGAIKGLVFGVIYALISSLLFALIAGGFDLGIRFFAEIVYCIVVGVVLGALAVNVKKT